MAQRVGKLHVHELPDEQQVQYMEVYRCTCNKEFFRGKTDKENLPTWIPLDRASHYVEYDVDDSPLIGRYVPEFPGVPRPDKVDSEEEPATVQVVDE